MNIFKQICFFTVLCMLTLQSANAESFNTYEQFKNYIISFVKTEVNKQSHEVVNVKIMHINSKLKLPSCPSQFQTTLEQAQSAESPSTVVLRCEELADWVLHIPVQIIHKKQVAVTTHAIAAFEAITEKDIEFQEREENNLPTGYYENNEALVGLVATKTITAGSVVAKNNSKQSPLIKKEQAITLVLKNGAVEINMLGIAKSDGYLNQPIKILNPSTKKIVDAIVIGSDRAELNL